MNKGFTFIETLVTLAIAAIVITIVALSFGKLNESQSLDKSSRAILSVIDEARMQTQSGRNASQYGVRFEADRVILFPGATYSPSNSQNSLTMLSGLVGIRNVSLSGGGAEVIFSRLTGATAQPGSLEVYLKSEPERFRTISISASGVAEIE